MRELLFVVANYLIAWSTRSWCLAFLPTQRLFQPRPTALLGENNLSPSFREEFFEFGDDDEYPEFDEEEPFFYEPARNTSSPLTLEELSETFGANVSYFYLKNELGLSDEAMWRITYDASSALGISTRVIKNKVELLRRTMDLSDEDIRSILGRQPTILHYSAERNLAPTLLFLLRSLELSREELRALVVACPCVLSYSISNLKSKVGFFTQIMEFSVKECRELFLDEPKLLRASVTTGLGPHLQFWASEIEMDLPQLQRLVKMNPRILLYSLEKNLIPKLIYYLLMRLQMTTGQVHKLLLDFPRFIDSNLERVIWPTTYYFIHELGFSTTEFRKILLKCPRLMSYSMSKIKHAVGYFRYELGMSAPEAQRVLLTAPNLFSLNIETNVKTKVDYLRATLGLDPDQFRKFVVATPGVLKLNMEANVEPKIEFLKQHLSGKELHEAVLRMPALLSYSLEKRIRPRLVAILEAGLNPATITVGIPKKEADFEQWLNRRAAELEQVMLPNSANNQPRSTSNAFGLSGGSADSMASNRITHWTRERRRRPDMS